MTTGKRVTKLLPRRYQRGVTAVEYALLASLITIAAIGAFSASGDSVLALYEHVAEKVVAALTLG